jgi:hypothetical protein
MRTPKDWTKNLKDGIITEDMLGAALYSVNKRAKNWRDKKREYQTYRYAVHDYAGQAEAQEQAMYAKKELLLSLVQPLCVHEESYGFERNRVYNFEDTYSTKNLTAIYNGLIAHTGYFHKRGRGYDYDDDYDDFYDDNIVTFADLEDRKQEKTRSYVYYVVGDYSFHSPITEEQKAKYRNLPSYFVGRILTDGHDIEDLVSVQFVDKMIALVQSGQYQYRPADLTEQEQNARLQKCCQGAVSKEKYYADAIQDQIEENIYGFQDYIFEYMSRELKSRSHEVLAQQKEEIVQEYRTFAETEIKQPCVKCLQALADNDLQTAFTLAGAIRRAGQHLRSLPEPKAYCNASLRSEILSDSLKRFGGKASVSVSDLVTAYPDTEYLNACAESAIRHEAAAAAFAEVEDKYHKTLTAVKNRKRELKQARKHK